ncbi:hypothetical protein D3C73_651700 [compost metagenome]
MQHPAVLKSSDIPLIMQVVAQSRLGNFIEQGLHLGDRIEPAGPIQPALMQLCFLLVCTDIFIHSSPQQIIVGYKSFISILCRICGLPQRHILQIIVIKLLNDLRYRHLPSIEHRCPLLGHQFRP